MIPALGDWKAEELGLRQQMLLRGRKGNGGGKRALGSGRGRGVCPAKATVREERTEDVRERKDRSGKARSQRPSQTQKTGVSPQKARAGSNAEGDKQCHPEAGRGLGRALTGASAGARSLERGLRPAQRLEGPAAQSFEHAHCARMVHLGTQALAGAVPPGPHQSPLNGDLDLG